MPTDPQKPALSALDEALDPELVARLRRPLVKPGIISSAIARRITGMVDYFSNRVPLMEEILQRRNVKGTLRHDDMPVVHAEPPRAPATPEAQVTVVQGETPKERVIVKPTERIVERAAPSAIERVIDRAAPPAAGLIEGRSAGRPERSNTNVMTGAPAPVAATIPVIEANTAGAATLVIEANPAAAVTPVIEANTAVAAPLVMPASPGAGEPRLVAAPNKDVASGGARSLEGEASPRPVMSPEVRVPSHESLPQVAPEAAVNRENSDAAADRPELTYGPDGTPQIHSLRRMAAEALAERSKRAAERGGEPPSASKAERTPAFTVMPRAQRPGEGQRRRDMGLVPVSRAQSAEGGSPAPPTGQRVQRPAAIDAPLFSDKPPVSPATTIAQSEPAPKPRASVSPEATTADMPPALHEVIARPGRQSEIAPDTGEARAPNTSVARVPVIQPARRIRSRGGETPILAEGSEPLVRVRPSSPPWIPSGVPAAPARSPEDPRPRVKPEPLPAAEAMQELLPKRGATLVSPLPKVNAIKAAAPAAKPPLTGEPLPPAASEVSTARLGQLVAAQVEGVPGAPSAQVISPAAPQRVPSPPAPPGDSTTAPPLNALQAPSAARRESALAAIDINALANQVQRKILRNLAVERARKGGIR